MTPSRACSAGGCEREGDEGRRSVLGVKGRQTGRSGA